MNEAELTEIETRADKALMFNVDHRFLEIVRKDVPVLIAEIRRLQAAIKSADRLLTKIETDCADVEVQGVDFDEIRTALEIKS